MLAEWEITDKIHIAVRDNASNMLCAFNKSHIDSAGCLSHSLQLVIKSEIFTQPSVKTLIEKCRDLSLFACKSINPIPHGFWNNVST